MTDDCNNDTTEVKLQQETTAIFSIIKSIILQLYLLYRYFTLMTYLRVQYTTVFLGFSLEVHDGEAEETERGCQVDEKCQSLS